MGFNNVFPGKPLSVTESKSSISILAPLTVFNIHSSEASPFQFLILSEMSPALDFSFRNLFYVQVHLRELRNQVLMVWCLPLLVRRIWLKILLSSSSSLITPVFQ